MSLVVALAATVGGCDSDPGERVAQRDVYTGPDALENCVADWGNEELCQQRLSDEEKKAMASGGDRTVQYRGNSYTPQTTRAVQTAAFNSNFKPSSFSAPHAAVTRGGFGATGRSVGFSSGG